MKHKVAWISIAVIAVALCAYFLARKDAVPQPAAPTASVVKVDRTMLSAPLVKENSILAASDFDRYALGDFKEVIIRRRNPSQEADLSTYKRSIEQALVAGVTAYFSGIQLGEAGSPTVTINLDRKIVERVAMGEIPASLAKSSIPQVSAIRIVSASPNIVMGAVVSNGDVVGTVEAAIYFEDHSYSYTKLSAKTDNGRLSFSIIE